MARYIDADLIPIRIRLIFSNFQRVAYEDEINKVPTADVVEVVRCKDCNHWIDRECQVFSMMMNDDDYCSYGERREK